MTDKDTLMNLIDAYAETRHRCGGIYNAKTEAARNAVIEALSGVQALSAAPAIGDELRDTLVAVSAAIAERDDRAAQKMISEILAASTTSPAEQQAPSAAAADTVVLQAALRAIHQAIDLIGEPDTERLRTVRRVLRGAVIVAEDAGEAATAPQPSSAPQTDSQPAVQQWNDLIGKETHADADGLLVWRDEVDFAIPTPPAEQQAQPDECFPGEPKVAVPQGLISAACFAIRKKRDGGKVLEQLRRYSVGDRSQPLAPQQAAPKAAPGDVLDEALRERDDAEDFIDALLDEVLGHERPEWSSSYCRADALNDVQERMTALHKPAVDKAWDQFQSAMEAPQQPAPSAAAAGQLRSDLVPGVMHCAKCKFQLNRVTLCVSDGNAYAGNNKTEPCPNGCGPLWPVTWEQEARNCWKALEEMHERLHPAPTPQADSQPAHQWDTGYPPLPRPDLYDAAAGTVGWSESALQGFVDADRAARAQADSVTAPAGGVDDAVDAIALARYKVVPAHESMFHRFAVVAGDGKQQLYLGREVECENMARKFAGAFLDGAFYQSNIAPTPPAPTADSVTTPADGANWQDISTAPKDGTRFVAVGNNYGRYSETQHTCIAQWFRGCWMEVSDWNEASELKYLTHWMPLPPLPGSAASAQADSVTAPAVASEPIAYLYDDGSWTPAKTEEGRKLNDWMISAGSPKIGVHLASTAQPTPLTTLAQATQAGNQQEAQEPVVWQNRTRPTWGGNTRPWSPWEPCTKEQAEDCWKTPLLHDWAYEARALFTAPQPAPDCHHRPPCDECAAYDAQGGK